ncbi:hypothetical protein, partial [Aeromonas veronii]|uniref:hypothetical protein n=1 Tax=Aeromonas veronii TaxID=654 RepID=UPI003D1B0E77
MSDEPSCSNDLDPQLPRCAWLLACSVSRKDASPQSSASARRIPGRILSGNGVHRFRNHCSNSPEYALRFPFHDTYSYSCLLGSGADNPVVSRQSSSLGSDFHFTIPVAVPASGFSGADQPVVSRQSMFAWASIPFHDTC